MFDAATGKSRGRLNKFYKYDRRAIDQPTHGVGGKERLGRVN